MPTSFQNMATLTYTGGTVNSNIVTGELREVLTAAKTAVRENYEPGGTVTYVVSLTNSGITPLTGLTISDNLGGYTFGGATLYPLAYLPGSVRYYVNGALQAAPVVNAGPPMTVTGITVPAGGSTLVIYETEVTRYAPLAAESSIVNTITDLCNLIFIILFMLFCDRDRRRAGRPSDGGGDSWRGEQPDTVHHQGAESHGGSGERPDHLHLYHPEHRQYSRYRDGRCDPPGYLRSGSQRSHGDLQRCALDCRYAVHL